MKKFAYEPSKPLKVSRGSKSRAEAFAFQAGLPATMRKSNGRLATLSEHLDPKVPTLSLDELTEEQWAKIAAKRVRLQENLELVIPFKKSLDGVAAAKEISRGSELGRILASIERSHLQGQLAEAVGKRKQGAKERSTKKKGVQK